MSPYADCPIVFASVFLSSFSFPLASPPPRRDARSVRMYGAFACRGLFKSSPYCRGSLFFPLSLQEWVSAWVPRLDNKKPADPRTENPRKRLPHPRHLNPPPLGHPGRSSSRSRVREPEFCVGHVDVTFLSRVFWTRFKSRRFEKCFWEFSFFSFQKVVSSWKKIFFPSTAPPLGSQNRNLQLELIIDRSWQVEVKIIR